MSRTERIRRAPKAPKTLGRPSPLTDRKRIDDFIDLVRDGNHTTTAAAAVGLGQSTIYQWLALAHDTQAMLTTAHTEATEAGLDPPDPNTLATRHALRTVEFADRLARARAEAERSVVATIGKVIRGGYLISRRPSLTADGTPIYDQDGELVYDEVYAQPDGKLALEFLSRARPQEWGRLGPQQIEVSGPGGAPLMLESGAQIKALAERLAETVALPAGIGEDEDIVDGVVEDAPVED